jgi:uroporphyrinogen decarboxylase
MKPREWVQRAFRFEETRQAPYWITMDPEVAGALDEYYGSGEWRDRIVPYMFGRHAGFRTVTLDDGTAREPFGTILREGNILHVLRPALAEPSLRGYDWPDLSNLEDWDALAEEYAAQSESFRLCGFAMGLFERAWIMRGFEKFMMDLVDHPSFVEELLGGIMDMHLRVMDLISERVSIEGYFGGDDWSDQRGVMMGIENWRRFFKPRLAKIIEHCHTLGYPYILHSCGNVLPLVDDLLETGLDGLESLQREAMDVYELKQRTAGKMVLIGGMGVQSTLRFGTPDDVREETKRLIRELGRGGGYVLATAKPMMEDIPVENAAAFVETAIQEDHE